MTKDGKKVVQGIGVERSQLNLGQRLFNLFKV